ncbi:uncharacterized protein B0H18DRAFT_988506 [Fomitopsis serialis]|uniref:uncharacterized protein n=1 Tax=Fomitopsis serialis TaxID=139415 RepID=UPI0020084597|nr:uncharacterized protein B0H18DRAFT_988506 [Neoantrodia serialis]KAH9931895.1 hypothetical protein B0H18DRAFT_988506 [Neoantrodia serialis]
MSAQHIDQSEQTLELLFQYMYRKRPDIGSISFDMLRSVADAADVYQMDAFGERFRAHPMDLSDVVDEAALRTIGTDVETALQALGRRHSSPGSILYREKWIHIMRDANDPPVIMHKGGLQSCNLWYTYYRSVTNDLRNFGPGEVQEGRSVFGRYRSSLKNCTHCKIRADNWARAFEAAPGRMPTFGSVVSETVP